MTEMNRILFLAIAVLVANANSALAGMLYKIDGSSGDISVGAGNDLIDSLSSAGLIDVLSGKVQGTYGANILFDRLDATDTVKFTFFGEEAGFNNSFQVFESGASAYTKLFVNDAGGGVYEANSASGLDLQSFSASDLAGTGDVFRFGINTTDIDPSSNDVFVYNNRNPDDLSGGADQNFFVVDVINRTDADGNQRNGFLLWLDDGGASNDDDHDDMVVFVEVIESLSPLPGPPNAVPEPSSMMMWAVIGLGCTSVRHRRRRK